jgi:tetratricopeptide (TPR) repeat protein
VRLTVVGCALVLCTWFAFRGVLTSAFINFDDDRYVTENPRVLAGLTGESVRWAFTTNDFGTYHPLTWLSHMLDVQLFGLDAGKHHRTSLILHTLNTLLLFLVLFRMTGALWRSALVAGLFAIHPLHVESVAWIAERKDVLSTLFWLLTLAAWLSYLNHRTTARYAAVCVLYAFGLMAKPMLVTLPFTLVLLDYWPLHRWTLRSRETWGAISGMLTEKIPLFALSGIFCLATLIGQSATGAVGSLHEFPMLGRVANSLLAYGSYLGKTVWPAGLALLYPWTRESLLTWRVAGSAVLIAGITYASIASIRRAPYLAFGWFWFLGTLVPVIGLVQVGTQSMADRYTYVPLVGVFIALSWGLAAVVKDSRPARAGAAVLAIAALTALFAATSNQVAYWKDNAALCEHALKVTSGNFVMYNNLGRALFDEDKTDAAIIHYTEALRIQPGYAAARNNLGAAYMKIGKSAEAAAELTIALNLKPEDPLAHYNLATLFARQGDLANAEAHFERALRVKPDFVDALKGSADVLERQGELAKAASRRDALAKLPQEPSAH